MTRLEEVLALELTGDAFRQWWDLAWESGFTVEVIADDEAEYRRVQAAACDEYIVDVAERFLRAPRPVRCGGLKAIEPEAGGDLKGWMKARVARLWQRRGRTRMLFEYLTKTKRRVATYDDEGAYTGLRRALAPVRKKQRWETRNYVTFSLNLRGDLDCDDSPAHLSGFGAGDDGKVKTRGMSGPRDDARDVRPRLNHQFDFNGGTP